jgi:hypothetical protein
MTHKSLDSQFTCVICGQGFEQKSRLQRQMDTSHPPSAPSAADVEKALSGIQYPKLKEALVEYVSQKLATVGKDVFSLIESLPNRTYRDSAEVAIALGELRVERALEVQRKPRRQNNQVKKEEKQPSGHVYQRLPLLRHCLELTSQRQKIV